MQYLVGKPSFNGSNAAKPGKGSSIAMVGCVLSVIT